jgi:uncharacterized membrane protein
MPDTTDRRRSMLIGTVIAMLALGGYALATERWFLLVVALLAAGASLLLDRVTPRS